LASSLPAKPLARARQVNLSSWQGTPPKGWWPMAKRARGLLTWKERPESGPSRIGMGRIKVYRESTHRYRIDHYLDYPDDPYFALANCRGRRPGRRMWELISRHATLEAAMRACDQHAAAGGL
jgi:hypothetical protein